VKQTIVDRKRKIGFSVRMHERLSLVVNLKELTMIETIASSTRKLAEQVIVARQK
jgi:hypothetical protein